MNIKFLKPAQIELDDAFDYYESQLTGLGYRFQAEIARSLTRISCYPNCKVGLPTKIVSDASKFNQI
jgi:hypothetical protein